MDLSELTHDETLVLLGLMRVVIQADGEFSTSEREHVALVRTALGQERFHAAMVEVTERFPTNDALKAATRAVTRDEARRAIHDVVVKIAESDTMSRDEEKPVRWLESWWGLTRRG